MWWSVVVGLLVWWTGRGQGEREERWWRHREGEELCDVENRTHGRSSSSCEDASVKFVSVDSFVPNDFVKLMLTLVLESEDGEICTSDISGVPSAAGSPSISGGPLPGPRCEQTNSKHTARPRLRCPDSRCPAKNRQQALNSAHNTAILTPLITHGFLNIINTRHDSKFCLTLKSNHRLVIYDDNKIIIINNNSNRIHDVTRNETCFLRF